MALKNKLTDKQKRILVLLTASVSVYLAVRFLLPVVLPFLFAYLLACLISPAAEWVNRKTRCPKMLAATVILILGILALAFPVVILVKKLFEQLANLINALPEYEKLLHDWLMKLCSMANTWFHVDETSMFEGIWEMLTDGVVTLKEGIMPWVIDHGTGLFSGFVSLTTVIFLASLAVILCIQEMDSIRKYEKTSMFRAEISMIKAPMARVGKAYLKTQFIIMAIVISELMFGLSLMGNRYSMLLGLLIGLLDALPLFGTGTVLIPWMLILLVMGSWGKLAAVAALYLLCYFTRQILEPKLMGNGTGLSSLQSLIAIYAGLKLFGLWGLFLGPICWIIILEFVNAYS